MNEIDALDRFGGRKFIFTVLLCLLAFILVLVNKADTATFLDFVKFIGGAYFVANVGVKVTDIFSPSK